MTDATLVDALRCGSLHLRIGLRANGLRFWYWRGFRRLLPECRVRITLRVFFLRQSCCALQVHRGRSLVFRFGVSVRAASTYPGGRRPVRAMSGEKSIEIQVHESRYQRGDRCRLVHTRDNGGILRDR